MLGATIFWIAGFTALPPIYNRLTSTAAQNGAYWLPQVIGGTGFIISGALFMLETQKKWWLPAWGTLGWHIGAWNLIGYVFCSVLLFEKAMDYGPMLTYKQRHRLHTLWCPRVWVCKFRSSLRSVAGDFLG